MPRPRKCRLVTQEPSVDFFKPRGVPMRELTEVYLTVEGYEALRLSDIEGLSQEEAAQRMLVSRHTFGRVLSQARRTVAEAVVLGRALRIEGGNYAIKNRGSRVSQPEPGPTPEPESGPRLESNIMEKIAITSEGPSLDDQVDPRFGRCGGFLIFDPQSQETQYVDNGSSQTRAQGAGIQAAEMVAKTGAKVLLTGYVGPNAFRALQAAGLRVGQDLGGLTVREAIKRFQDGQVEMASAPNREGHWQ